MNYSNLRASNIELNRTGTLPPPEIWSQTWRPVPVFSRMSRALNHCHSWHKHAWCDIQTRFGFKKKISSLSERATNYIWIKVLSQKHLPPWNIKFQYVFRGWRPLFRALAKNMADWKNPCMVFTLWFERLFVRPRRITVYFHGYIIFCFHAELTFLFIKSFILEEIKSVVLTHVFCLHDLLQYILIHFN
jgi:hypothetical protein